jgi:hypothetical protein
MSLKSSSTRSGTLMRSPRMSMSGGGAASPFLEGDKHQPEGNMIKINIRHLRKQCVNY